MYKYWTSDNSRLILVATIKVIRSNKGKPKLLFENYAYSIKHQKITSIGIALKKGYPAKAVSKQLMTWTTLYLSNVCESTIASIKRAKLFKTIALKFTCSMTHVRFVVAVLSLRFCRGGFVVAVLSRVGFVQCMFCRGGFDVVCFVVVGFVWIPEFTHP